MKQSFLLLLFCLVVVLLPFASVATTCDVALRAFGFALQTVPSCQQNSSSSSLCAYLDPTAAWVPPASDEVPWLRGFLAAALAGANDTSVEQFPLEALVATLSNIDDMLTGQLSGGGGVAARAATLGEVAGTMNRIGSRWVAGWPFAKPSDFWGVWIAEWTAASNDTLAIAATRAAESPASYAWALLRASNYLFVASQPAPVLPAALMAMQASYSLLWQHLDAMQALGRLRYENVSVPYTDTHSLPGFLAWVPRQGSDDASQQRWSSFPTSSQLVLSTCGGLDWPLPGEVVLSLYSYLDSGRAVLYYQGPGQGETVFNSTAPLKFTNRWDMVLAAVARYAHASVLPSVPQLRNDTIVAVSASFGAFLLPQACSGLSTSDAALISGCMADSGNPNIAWAINYDAWSGLLAPFQTVPSKVLAEACSGCAEMMQAYWFTNDTAAMGGNRTAAFLPDPLMSTLLDPEMCPQGVMLVEKVMAQALTEMRQSSGGLVPSVFLWMALAISDNTTPLQIAQWLDNTSDSTQLAIAIVNAFASLQNYWISEQQIAGTAVRNQMLTAQTRDSFYESTLTNALAAVWQAAQLNVTTAWFDVASGAAQHCELGAYEVAWPFFDAFYASL